MDKAHMSVMDESDCIDSLTRVYLDYNATTPLEPQVLAAIHEALAQAWGNPSSSYEAGIKAKAIIAKARANVAAMIGGRKHDIIFTSGGTEANNMVFWSAVNYYWKVNANCGEKALPHFITSNLEHDSVQLVLSHFKEEGVADVTCVPASKRTGKVDVDDIISAIRPNTCMITLMMVNNETGVLQPVEEVSRRLRARGPKTEGEFPRVLLHTDAAQAIGKICVDVNELGVDYLTVVGHKFYGPRIGALYVRGPGEATPISPMFFGGGQERNYRPGTENTGMIAGLGKAAELVLCHCSQYEDHMRDVRDYLESQLQDIFGEGVRFNSKFEGSSRIPNTSNISFIGPGLEGNRVLCQCERLQASVGAACHAQNRASPILLALGIPESVAQNALRLSVGRETSKLDIDIIIKDLVKAVRSLSGQQL